MIKLSVMPRTETPEERRAFMKYLSDSGMTTVCAAKTGNCIELFDFEPCFPLVLFIGGEKRGISPDYVDMCDKIVSIPYFSDAKYSLPTASTAAIFGFKLAEHRI
jgi:tRNA G18 (ribose-2'-O)-methylase SpoU